MMKSFFVVAGQELKSFFRDTRCIVAFLLPLVIFPVFFSLSGVYYSNSTKLDEIKIAFDCNEDTQKTVENLMTTDSFVFIDTNTPYSDMDSGDVQIVISDKDETLTVNYDSSSLKSSSALQNVLVIIENYNNSVLIGNPICERLISATTNDCSESDSSTVAIASMIPMMIVLFALSGCTGMASEIFAGEKERGTLEIVVCSSVNRAGMVLAKTFSIFVVSLLNTVVSLAGYAIAFLISPEAAEMYGMTGNNNITSEELIKIIVTVAVFSFFVASLTSHLSLSSKSSKEANMKISLFSFIPTIAGTVIMFAEMSDVSSWGGFIPFFNTILSFKSILMHSDNDKLMITTNIVLSTLSVILSLVNIIKISKNPDKCLGR